MHTCVTYAARAGLCENNDCSPVMHKDETKAYDEAFDGYVMKHVMKQTWCFGVWTMQQSLQTCSRQFGLSPGVCSPVGHLLASNEASAQS